MERMLDYNSALERGLPEGYVANINPTEFELLIKSYLDGLGYVLKSYNSEHNTREQSHDGKYQIDIKAEFEALGGVIKVLIECKKYTQPVKREKVEILLSRLNSLGWNKGMIFSASGFQNGAIEFAGKHGIALIRIKEGKFIYETKSAIKPSFENADFWPELERFTGTHIYNINERGFSSHYVGKGKLESIIEYLSN